MNTRFYNGNICTMQDDCAVFWGEIWVQEGHIVYSGPAKQPDIPFEREINLNGNLVLPGFKNAHTHSAMTFLRSFADDLPLLDWLQHQVFPMEAKLQPEHIYWLTKLAILEYLQSGITANLDMYMHAEEGARAAIEIGFRSVLTSNLNNFVSNVDEMVALHDKLNGMHELISSKLTFHAEYTCSPKLLQNLADVVHARHLPMYTHNSESAREVAECVARTGATPTVYMNRFGLFDYGGATYHCVHVTEEDLHIMQEKGMAVVSCPGSNVKLASGIAPLSRMLALGIPVALGTDGPASNNCLDMFREMFLATGLQKLAQDDAAALDGDTVLRMATVSGADVMGLCDCNSLATGKRADLIVIDMAQPNMQPVNNLTKNVVYSGSKQNVKLTMVNGQILYEDGQFFVNEDPAVIYQKANEIILSMRQGT